MFILKTCEVVKENYNEFYKEQLNAELRLVDGILEQDGDNYYKELVKEYEEFYDEKFIYENELPWEKEYKKIDNPFDFIE